MTTRATPSSRFVDNIRELDAEEDPFPREETPLPRDLPGVPLDFAFCTMSCKDEPTELLIRHGFPFGMGGTGGGTLAFGLGAAFTRGTGLYTANS